MIKPRRCPDGLWRAWFYWDDGLAEEFDGTGYCTEAECRKYIRWFLKIAYGEPLTRKDLHRLIGAVARPRPSLRIVGGIDARQ